MCRFVVITLRRYGKTNKESPFLSALPHGRSAEGIFVAEFSHDADFLSNPRSPLFLFLLRTEDIWSCALSANRRRQIEPKTGEGPAVVVCVGAFVIYSMFLLLIMLHWDMSSSRRGVHKKIEFLSWTEVKSKKARFQSSLMLSRPPSIAKIMQCRVEKMLLKFRHRYVPVFAYVPRRHSALKFRKVSASFRSSGGRMEGICQQIALNVCLRDH